MTSPQQTVITDVHPATSPDQDKLRSRLALTRRLEGLPLVVALLLVIVIFQVLTGLFLNPRNLVNLLTELAPLGFIAMASTVMIIMGEIDLSLGSLAGLTGAVLAALLANEGIPWPLALCLAFVVGVGISGLQGIIVVVGRVRSFAVTLAGYLVWYGVQLAMLGISGYIALRRAPINELSLARIPEAISLGLVAVIGLALIAIWLFGKPRGGAPKSAASLAIRLAGALAVLAAILWFVT
jgi:D-xylose transport system permease protein